MWASEWPAVTPDMMAVSKSIAAGIPLAALILRKDLDEKLPDAFHLGTYRGNAVATAAGAEVVEFLKTSGVIERARMIGEEVKKFLTDLMGRIKNYRGCPRQRIHDRDRICKKQNYERARTRTGI